MAARTRASGVAGSKDAVADGVDGGLGGQFAGGLSAHAVHHQEDATGGIDPVAVLIALADQAGIGGGGGEQGSAHRGERPPAITNTTTKARKATTNGMCRR